MLVRRPIHVHERGQVRLELVAYGRRQLLDGLLGVGLLGRLGDAIAIEIDLHYFVRHTNLVHKRAMQTDNERYGRTDSVGEIGWQYRNEHVLPVGTR